jgi:hypothetical protein
VSMCIPSQVSVQSFLIIVYIPYSWQCTSLPCVNVHPVLVSVYIPSQCQCTSLPPLKNIYGILTAAMKKVFFSNLPFLLKKNRKRYDKQHTIETWYS